MRPKSPLLSQSWRSSFSAERWSVLKKLSFQLPKTEHLSDHVLDDWQSSPRRICSTRDKNSLRNWWKTKREHLTRSGWRYSALCYLLDVSNITHIQTKSASQCNNVSALCLQTDAQNAKKRLLPTSTAIICFFISLYHRIKSRRVDFLQLFLHLLFSVGCTVDLKRTYSCFSPPHLLTVSNRRRLVFLV